MNQCQGRESHRDRSQALAEAGQRRSWSRPDVHYLRGRVLLEMGRKDEAKKELDAAQKIEAERGSEAMRPSGRGIVPSPELLAEPQ